MSDWRPLELLLKGLASMVVTEAQVVGLIGDIGVGLAVASHLVILYYYYFNL